MILIFSSPGGELNPGEDDIEGLKRLLTEVKKTNLMGKELMTKTKLYLLDSRKTRWCCSGLAYRRFSRQLVATKL